MMMMSCRLAARLVPGRALPLPRLPGYRQGSTGEGEHWHGEPSSLEWEERSRSTAVPQLGEHVGGGVHRFYADMNAIFGPIAGNRSPTARHAEEPGGGDTPKCGGCGGDKLRRLVNKEGPNRGRQFWCCPLPMGSQCGGQFQWCDAPSLPPPPACKCGQPKVVRTVKKEGENKGRQFFSCPKPPGQDQCRWTFQWCDELHPDPELKKVVDGRQGEQVERWQVNKLADLRTGEGEQWHGEPTSQEWEEPSRSTAEGRSGATADCQLLNYSRASLQEVGSADLGKVLRIPLEADSSLPSVTRVLAATMSEQSKRALAAWEDRMTRQLGEAGFRQHKLDTFARGHTLHGMVETYFETGCLPDIAEVEDPVSKLHVISFSTAMASFSSPLAIESAVQHPELGYRGVVDCVARLGDQLVLVDWKTSEREKKRPSDLYDNPLQLAAYLGAINADPRYSGLGGNITSAAVCVVHNSGLPAVTHQFSVEEMENYWQIWLQRLQLFRNNN